MTRQARRVSSTGFYHVMFRGVNHCHLFEEEQDFEKLMDYVVAVQEEFEVEVHAYCLMSNHGHFLMREKAAGDLQLVMKKILAPYASWFNRKYERCGALIADRYKSVCVENDPYLLTLVRYIHQNPIAAGMADRCEQYRWSSYRDYLVDQNGFAKTEFVLSMFSVDPADAVNRFEGFHQNTSHVEIIQPDRRGLTHSQVLEGIMSILDDVQLFAISGMAKLERDNAISLLRKKGYSIRQIERATGVPRGIILRAH